MNRATITSAVLMLAAALCAAAAAAAVPTPPAAAATTARTPAVLTAGINLLGVSCVTAEDCMAVGFGGTAGSPLAETWNGSAWRAVSVPLPRGATSGALRGVSCVAAARCVAVGFYDAGPAGDQFPLAEAWNGTAWTPARPPAPGGIFPTTLDRVSCTSAARCVAVGNYEAPDHAVTPLAELWNGKAWTRTRPQTSENGFRIGVLAAVSCPSATRCLAVGTPLATVGVALIEWWNGTAWSAGKAAAVPGNPEVMLAGVSCPAAGSCVVVGLGTYATSRSSTGRAISQIWNGKSWRYAAVPLTALLLGVACVAASRCVAVGDADSGDTQRAAALTWNGKAWAVTSVPAPVKGDASMFNDVSCLSAADCVAVGQVGPPASPYSTALTGFWNGKSWHLVTAKEP